MVIFPCPLLGNISTPQTYENTVYPLIYVVKILLYLRKYAATTYQIVSKEKMHQFVMKLNGEN